MHDEIPDAEAGSRAGRPGPTRVFARVMIVQVITLWLLWMLQSTFGRA